jgi:hypothetical protein
MNELDLKRNRIEKRVKIVATIVVTLALGFLVAPIVFTAIKGLFGLIAVGAIALVTINLVPWFSAMVANWRLKAIKYEAAKNPIETLQNNYNERYEALVAFRKSIETSSAAVATFRGKLDGFKKDYPQDAAKYDEQYDQMKQLLQIRAQKYRGAKAELASYEAEIKRVSAQWDIAQEAAKMNKAATGVDTEAFLAKIQVSTALDSVQKSLNMAFADLELSLGDEKPVINVTPAQATGEAPTALENGRSPLDLVIDETDHVPVKQTRKP